MKQIISSKGKFNITDSLYESIKKNNPELLETDYSSFNIFAEYDGKVKDIIQKLRLNSNEVNDLEKRLKSYENSVKDAFGVNNSDKAYKVCSFYLDNIYNSSNGNKDRFLSNVSSKYDPKVISDMIVKSNKKSFLDDNKGNKVADEEILDTIASSLNISVNDLSDEEKKKLISVYNNEIKNNGGDENKAWDKVGKQAEEIFNDVQNGNPKKSFEEYIKSYKGDEPYINIYIKQLLSKYIPNEKYVDEAVDRYMKSFNIDFSDTSEISDEEYIDRVKKNMIELYNKVSDDCYKLKQLISKAKKEVNKNKINEAENDSNENDSIEDNIFKYFSENGVDFVEKHLDMLIHNNVINQGEFENMKSKYNIPDEELLKRVKDLQSSYITNDTIDYIKDLYDEYVKNSASNEIDEDYKIKCIKRVYRVIQDGYDRLNAFLKKGEEDEKNKNINKIKDRIAYLVRKSILGVKDENFAPIDNFDTKEFNIWLEKNITELLSSDNLLKHLTNYEWKEFGSTLDYPKISSVKTGEESINKFVKKIIDIVRIETFDSKIPGVILNYVKSINDKISGKVIKIPPFLKFFNFGTKKVTFLNEQLKSMYIDLTKNEGEIYRDIKLHDVYRAIPIDEFWKNACVFHCWTHEAYNIVLSAISELDVRDDIDIYRNIITTGLPASTQIFSLSTRQKNDDGKYESRDNNKLFVDKNINDMKIIDKINRKYFIVVTEGIIRKGKLINDIYKGAKNIFKNATDGNNLFGIDMSHTRVK